MSHNDNPSIDTETDSIDSISNFSIESMASIEADSDLDEVSSQYDSCYSSIGDNTCTLYSEITNYKWENGRRYHAYAEGSYWAPNDEKQNTQLDIFHHVFTLMLDGKLFLAPIEEPTNVLDLGTGTGIWAIELADAFPNATVLGNDLSPVQPTWIPSNCSFEVDDYLRPWLYSPGSFDLIHARGCYGSVSDWSLFTTEAFTALQPGGWFESVEISSIFRSDFYPGNTLPDSSLVKQWGQHANEACEVTGRPMDIAGHVGGFMKKAGFVNVVQKSFKIPHGPWPKDEKLKMIGKVNLVNVLEGAEGFTLALFTRHLGWDVERTREFLEQTKKELLDHKKMLWMHMVVAYGQKPIDAELPSETESAYDSAYASSSRTFRGMEI